MSKYSFSDIFDCDMKCDTKTCTKCKKELPLSEFSWCSGGSYLRTECKKCNNTLSKERKKLKETAPKIPENHICPICLKPEAELVGRGGKNNSTFVLDHCHETNTFRGYICQSCNRGLGMFNSVEIIENAKKYLNGIYLKY